MLLKRLTLIHYIFFFIAVCSFSLKAQISPIDSIFNQFKPVSIEKIYLQTDREFYALGDTIWYKAYSIDGYSNKPMIEEHNLTVELISEAGHKISSQYLLLLRGYACADIRIPDSIPAGNYFIRAFTPILQCLGEHSFFHKMIRIEKIMNYYEQQALYSVTEYPEIADIAFLPEGGTMVYNVPNNIAFKSVSNKGKGIDISGTVIDETGNPVVEFSTIYKGMGKFSFIPGPDHKYFIKIKDHPQFNYEFKDISHEGLILQIRDSDPGNISVSVIRNPERKDSRKLFLTAMFRDEFIFYVQVDLTSSSKLVRIDKGLFPAGIVKLTLCNERFEPLAERLVFRNNPVSRIPVTLDMDKSEYCSREKAVLTLNTGITGVDSGFFSISASVINTGYINSSGLNLNILAYLLLDSELKGVIESPPSFFEDDPSLKSSDKLDLLMLTQGWRKYLWDEYHAVQPEYNNISNLAGMPISGRVKRLIGKKPIREGQVILMIFDEAVSIVELKTDREGKFNSGPLYFSDSTSILVQAKNEKDKKFTEIFLDTVASENMVSVDYILRDIAQLDVPLKFFRYNYYRRHAETEYNRKIGILLDPVTITAKKPTRTNDFQIYSVADNTLKIREQDYSYSDVLSYLQSRVPGVNVEGDNITVRGYSTFSSGGGALIIIDGIPYGNDAHAIEMLKSIPMSHIDRIDVLKNIINLSLFGSRGAGGVIAVYTKRGEIGIPDTYVPGLITARIKGYHKMRQFYSPAYNEQNLNQEKPDYRPTLYWNPLIDVDEKGESQLEFFTSDELSDYLVVLEGITSDGRIIFGTTSFLVDMINPKLRAP